MEIIGLILGLGAARVSKLKLSEVIGILILGGAILGVCNITSVLPITIGLGLGVGSTVKQIVKNNYKNSVKEKVEDKKEEVENKLWLFISTVIIGAFPLYLASVIGGLSGLFLPLSILFIVWKGYNECLKNPSNILLYVGISVFLGVGAFIALNTFSSSSVLIYFLTLITIPSFIFKSYNVEEEEEKVEVQENVFNLESVLYGVSNSGGMIVSALLMLQTIIWASGKDIIGTVVNGDLSILLNPYRIGFTAVISLFLILYKNLWLQKDLETIQQELDSDEPENNIVNIILSSGSLLFSLFSVNPLLVLGLTVLGFIIHYLAKNNALVRKIALPLILIVGTFGIA